VCEREGGRGRERGQKNNEFLMGYPGADKRSKTKVVKFKSSFPDFLIV